VTQRDRERRTEEKKKGRQKKKKEDEERKKKGCVGTQWNRGSSNELWKGGGAGAPNSGRVGRGQTWSRREVRRETQTRNREEPKED